MWRPVARLPRTALPLIGAARHTCDVELSELGNSARIAGLAAARARDIALCVALDATDA